MNREQKYTEFHKGLKKSFQEVKQRKKTGLNTVQPRLI